MLKILKARIVGILILELLVALFFLKFGLIYHVIYRSSVFQGNHNTGVFVYNENPVGQTVTFDSDVRNIGKIGLFIDYSQWGEDEKLALSIWDTPLKKKLLRTNRLKRPNQYWVFAEIKPPLKLKQGEIFYIEVTHNGGGDNQIGWIVSSDDNPYLYGELYEGGKVQKNSDLAFQILKRDIKPNYLGIFTLLLFFVFMHLRKILTKFIGKNADAAFLKIFLVLTILYIMFLAYPSGSVIGNLYSGDDNSYYGYVSSIVNDFDLNFYNNEVVGGSFKINSETGALTSMHPIGTSFHLMPFYIVGKPIVHLYHWLTGTPYDQKHPFYFVLMSSGIVFYLFLGGFLLFKTVSYMFNEKISLIAVTLSIWGTILPVYAFKRPIYSPVPEFFLISLLLYLIVRLRNQLKSGDNRGLAYWWALLLGLVNGAIIITRWNDIHVLLFSAYFLLFIDLGKRKNLGKRKFICLIIFIISVGAVFFFTQMQAWKYFFGSYFKLPYNLHNLLPSSPGRIFPSNIHQILPFSMPQILTSELPYMKLSLLGVPLIGFLKNPLHILIGPDWGILYTMFPMAVGLVLFLSFNPLKISRRGILDRFIYSIVLLIPFLVILIWKHQASYYGYRYLLSLLPFSCIGVAYFFKYGTRNLINNRKFKKFVWICVALLVIFNILLMLPFENSSGTTLDYGVSTMGAECRYINNKYFINAVKFYFTSSFRDIFYVFQQGFAAAYVHGLERRIVSVYPLIVISLIIISFFILRKKL